MDGALLPMVHVGLITCVDSSPRESWAIAVHENVSPGEATVDDSVSGYDVVADHGLV